MAYNLSQNPQKQNQKPKSYKRALRLDEESLNSPYDQNLYPTSQESYHGQLQELDNSYPLQKHNDNLPLSNYPKANNRYGNTVDERDQRENANYYSPPRQQKVKKNKKSPLIQVYPNHNNQSPGLYPIKTTATQKYSAVKSRYLTPKKNMYRTNDHSNSKREREQKMSPNKFQGTLDRMERYQKEKERKLTAMKIQMVQDAQEECVHKPRINPEAPNSPTRLKNYQNQEADPEKVPQPQQSKSKTRVPLTERSSQIAQDQIQKRQTKIKQNALNEELRISQDCTFKPILRAKSPFKSKRDIKKQEVNYQKSDAKESKSKAKNKTETAANHFDGDRVAQERSRNSRNSRSGSKSANNQIKAKQTKKSYRDTEDLFLWDMQKREKIGQMVLNAQEKTQPSFRPSLCKKSIKLAKKRDNPVEERLLFQWKVAQQKLDQKKEEIYSQTKSRNPSKSRKAITEQPFSQMLGDASKYVSIRSLSKKYQSEERNNLEGVQTQHEELLLSMLQNELKKKRSESLKSRRTISEKYPKRKEHSLEHQPPEIYIVDQKDYYSSNYHSKLTYKDLNLGNSVTKQKPNLGPVKSARKPPKAVSHRRHESPKLSISRPKEISYVHHFPKDQSILSRTDDNQYMGPGSIFDLQKQFQEDQNRNKLDFNKYTSTAPQQKYNQDPLSNQLLESDYHSKKVKWTPQKNTQANQHSNNRYKTHGSSSNDKSYNSRNGSDRLQNERDSSRRKKMSDVQSRQDKQAMCISPPAKFYEGGSVKDQSISGQIKCMNNNMKKNQSRQNSYIKFEDSADKKLVAKVFDQKSSKKALNSKEGSDKLLRGLQSLCSDLDKSLNNNSSFHK